jgi:esterase/lipase
MGALLSLELTRKHPGTFSTTVFIVPPIKLRSLFFRYATPLMKVPLFNRLMPIVKKSDLFPGHVTYDRYSPSATGELAKLMETVSRSAPVSCPPTMICYSLGDKMVHPDSFDLFTRKVISEDKYVLQLSESTHVVPIAEERKLFLSELERFFRKQLQVSP